MKLQNQVTIQFQNQKLIFQHPNQYLIFLQELGYQELLAFHFPKNLKDLFALIYLFHQPLQINRIVFLSNQLEYDLF